MRLMLSVHDKVKLDNIITVEDDYKINKTISY